MENKKSILITGGLGFIGAHCIEKWKENDWEICVIDNLSTNAISRNNFLTQGVSIIEDDILNVKWQNLPKFDLILHLASPVGPVGVLKHSGNMARIILDDIYWAVDGAKYNNCPLVFVSTSEIYGHRESKSYLKEEDDKVLHGDFTVRNEYAIAKLLSEIVLTNQAKINPNFRYQIIRPFNVTGKYQLPDGGFVLPRFVKQALSNEDITVYYDGSQLRAFTWVKDIVDGIYLTSIAPEEYWNEEWNIGNEQNERTILYLAEKVKEITESYSTISNVDPTELHGPLFAEAPEKIPNSEKIKKILGWNPTKGVDEVILEVVEYYKNGGYLK
jgi:nucleoside-diphosphate-sugar epimerase